MSNRNGLKSIVYAADRQTTAKPQPGASDVGDSLYPGFGNGGYDVQHYTLDFNVTNVKTSQLNGLTTIAAKATQDLSRFNLDFVGFAIDGITINGKPAKFSRKGQELTITPARPFHINELFTAEVKYHGSPTVLNSVVYGNPVGWIPFDGGSFVLSSQPDGAANYYPVNDHPIDKATYSFNVTVPEPFEVAANGVLKSTTDNGNTTTYRFEARDPMVSYLTTVNIGQFDIETGTMSNGIPIRNYFGDEIPKDLLKPFDLQPEMLSFFSDTFGTYPFEVYGAIVINSDVGSALETQTLSIFGAGDLGQTSPYQGGFLYYGNTEELVAHEMSHQWFGDSVSLSDWGDIWLNESFATYAQGLWVEHKQGHAALNQWIKNTYNEVVDAKDTLVTPGKPPANDLFNGGVYNWGALALHALRLQIGDDAFFTTLKTYTSRFKNGNVRPNNFIAIAETVSQSDLKGFFADWIYSGDIPNIPALGLSSAPTGDQTLFGNCTDDAIYGRDGNDRLFAKGVTHVLIGGAGDDKLYGDSQADTLLAGDGNDILYGKGGTNTLDGGSGDDLIYGGTQADTMLGGEGNDTMMGGKGNDILFGGSGNNVLVGDKGSDIFALEPGIGQSIVKDFQLQQDTLGLTAGLSFKDLSFKQKGRNTLISVGKDQLMLLIDVNSSQITPAAIKPL
jgi:Ca2+-binding RTX toxin-like protein